MANSSDATGPKGGLFRLANGKNMLGTFVLVTTLFLLWGFCNGLIDVLNKHFQTTLHINKFHSGFVQTANYLAYFLMAIPAGMLARKFGYKGGIVIGLSLIVLGALWFVRATQIGTYFSFLAGLFILASGMACLETIANPYTTVIGPARSSATRINIAQTFNGVGWILGPVVVGYFVFGGQNSANANEGLFVPYLGIAVVVLAMLAVFSFAYVPDLQAEEETQQSVLPRGRPLWHRSHFVFGVVAQFLYVSAQAGIFGFFINYVLENVDTTPTQAASWLGAIGFSLFTIGRLFGIGAVSVMKPQSALTIYALVNVGLCAASMLGGQVGLLALFGTFFFMSIMFPTIFALSIHGLGAHTKLGSSLVVMSIIGGAIAPPLMGHIADVSSMRVGFLVPLACFALIALYGAFWSDLEAADARAKSRPDHRRP